MAALAILVLLAIAALAKRVLQQVIGTGCRWERFTMLEVQS